MSQVHSTDELEWDLLDRLHKALRVGHLNATTLAEHLGVHRNTVNNYLSGRTKPDRRTLMAWSTATGVPLPWLEDGTAPGPGGPEGGEVVRHRRLERRTRWFSAPAALG